MGSSEAFRHCVQLCCFSSPSLLNSIFRNVQFIGIWVKLSTFNVTEFIETHEIMCCVNNDNVFPCCEVLVGLFLTNLNMVKLKLAYLCKTERLLLWNGILRMTQQVTPQTLYNLKCKDCKKCCIFTLAET